MHFTLVLVEGERKGYEKVFPHLNRQNMVTAMVREMRESVYPAVYMVFT